MIEGYRATKTQPGIEEQLYRLSPDATMPLPMRLVHLSHSPPKEGATRPELIPYLWQRLPFLNELNQMWQ